jgi:protein ImuB
MGEKHVGSPALVDTWKPGAFEMEAFRPDATTSPVTPPVQHAAMNSALRRFRFPIPTRVVVSEGRPVRVQTDRQGFSSGAIVESAGPWRTSGEWWADEKDDSWDRDEWDVSMQDGTVYRLVVEREVGQWFLEGVID